MANRKTAIIVKAARKTAHEMACRLRRKGAHAVVLMGSYAWGKVHYASDLDLVVIGKGPEHVFESVNGFLVSIGWYTIQQARRSFRDPYDVGKAVPGWRTAIILHDPHGIVRKLRKKAKSWRWRSIEGRCKGLVAADITHLAENVHKLLGCISLGRSSAAAICRSWLALRLTAVLSIHKHVLYGSENTLCDMVAKRMGEPWARYQRITLGLKGGSFMDTCRAALVLYLLTASELWSLLDCRQRKVVGSACRLIRSRFRDLPRKGLHI